LRDILATDGGLLKLQDLVKAAQNNAGEMAQQRSFEEIYGISFNQWLENKAITSKKEALGIPNFQSGRLAEPKFSIPKDQINTGSKQRINKRGSLQERVFHV
jgi:hypothetical protein